MIANIADTSRFEYRERLKPHPLFLHNRGLEEVYNVPCALRAFAIVQEKYPEARLIVAHDGPLRQSLERLARELALKNVEFVGSVSQQQMAEMYAAADIYLMSPNTDNMPLSVLECYASGLPVISTSGGGVPDLVIDGRTGLLSPVADHQALAASALRLIEEEGLGAELARNGRAECSKYAGDVTVRKWRTLYGELTAHGSE